METEQKSMTSYPAQNPQQASGAFVLREIAFIVRSILAEEIAERHLHVIGQGAEDLLNFIICTINPISGRLPSLDDLPIGHLLTISPERVASMCTQVKPLLCREESARRVALFQNHAASMGYGPSPAAEAWIWLFHLLSERRGGIQRVRPTRAAPGTNLETEYPKWLRSQRAHPRQK